MSEFQATEKDVRLPLDGERLIAWQTMLREKSIGQQKALYALIDWIVKQDDIVKSMVLGQLRPSADLTSLVLARLEHEEQPPATSMRLPPDKPKLPAAASSMKSRGKIPRQRGIDPDDWHPNRSK